MQPPPSATPTLATPILATPSLSDTATRGDGVFERILDMIYRCELPPGAVLNESVLAARFGLSRGPVREAVRRLQGIQLVTREPFTRARVITFDPAAVRDLFEMREALEGYACRLAAERMTDQELDALASDLEAQADKAAAAALDGTPFDFHERIVRASRNGRIVKTLCGDLYHLLRMYRRWSGAAVTRKSEALTEHRQIYRALRNRDGELSESLMRSHIARAAANVISRAPAEAGDTDTSAA
ncbi:GntR family transcriptional regulator [Rhodoplanes serenus]|uniref:GntR family transcriptional regulator n=1 Tax=Rhodoplanes serenus TaxID=200615 RepID=UPI000DAB5DA9|nr:GntR family transcriptional regulator [Rhodoplanes serenus]RAI30567.1 hypothetical protein CH340_21220 [Rhodoplanes serenus]